MKSEEIKMLWLEHKDKISKSAANFLYRAFLAQRDFEISLNNSEFSFIKKEGN